MNYLTCPMCSTVVKSQNSFNGIYVCHECGTTVSSKSKKTSSYEFISNSLSFLIFSSLIVFSLIVIKKWDIYAIQALPLQAKVVSGLSSDEDTLKLIEICEKRKNLECVEKYANQLINQKPKHEQAWKKLARNYFIHNLHGQAFATYKAFADCCEMDSDSYFKLGKLFVMHGSVEKGIDAFESALQKKPDILQITVLQHYVQALIKDKQYKKAAKKIEFVQKNSRKSLKFMDTELQKLKRYVQSSNKYRFKKLQKKSLRKRSRRLPEKA